jgi:amino acid adenylation domain-containing protein
LEAALARLWSRILGIIDIGTDDDFFLLGGDRPGLDSLIASVNSLFRVDLNIESLSQDAITVAGMARAIVAVRSRAAADKQSETHPTVIARRQEGEAPHLSAAQKRMWFLARLNPDDPTYNQSRAYRLVGEIDVDALDRSVRYIARRHEILRTSYSLVNDEPEPIVSEDIAVEINRADLREVPSSQQNEALQTLLLSEMKKTFDLKSGPPWRMLLVHLSRREHVLLRVAHHIVSDGWTSGIFERELSAVYSAFVLGLEPRLPVLPVQYADYAAWQRESLQGKAIKTQLSYWRTQLAGLSKLDLPTDRPRPPVASYRGANHTVELPAPLVAALKRMGRQDGATLFMKLVAIFQVLLYRYSGQEDIAVGMPIAGRKRTELEGLLGFFTNTLVLRTDLSGSPSFRELLARVRETALDAYTHQDVPFERLVEELAPERDMSRTPLFQVTFVLQNVPDAALEMEGLKTSSVPLESHSAKFDLTLFVSESAQGLQTNWEYAIDLFDAVTIKRMARHFERLLEAVVADPDRRISDLPILTDAEKHQLLVEWNDTKKNYPKDKCLHQLFEEQVKRAPDSVAVIFEDQRLTYEELNTRANQLAHYLKKLRVGPEMLVGICMDRSLDTVVALLGVLKAGGAYLPLDSSYPAARLDYMLKNSGAEVLLTLRKLAQQLPPFEGRIVCLDQDRQKIIGESGENPSVEVETSNLAYIIYTSGSTGQPKGVMVPHGAVGNHMMWMREKFPLGKHDRVAQRTSLSFDASVWELFAPLIDGAQLVLAPPEVARDAESLIHFVQKEKITILQVVPALLQILVELDMKQCTSLRRVFCGGEPLSADLCTRFGRQLTAPLINVYGPTETAIDATAYVYSAKDFSDWVAIGRPIANTQVYILDEYLNPVPIGVVGEIYIGGDGVARGYLNQPELTAEKFITHSFDGETAKRLYRTGDLARYRPDGNIEYLGRRDNQVKIRGYRIEPREIEAVLNQHVHIRESVVIAREDTPGDKRPVAYIVPVVPNSAPSTNELRGFLCQKLPEYMIPSAFVFLDSLPLTPNGKLNRQALPMPKQTRPELDEAFSVPRTPVEELLANIWAKVLKLGRVGIYDNFFQLGGHSLLAAQVVNRLRSHLKLELPLRRLFEKPTIAELAEDVAQKSEEDLK